MWTRWRGARPGVGRVSTALGAALRAPAPLAIRTVNAPVHRLLARALSTSNTRVKAKQSQGQTDDPLARASRCLDEFLRVLSSARLAEQLEDAWYTLVKHKPVVVTDGRGVLRSVGAPVDPSDERSRRVAIPSHSLAVLMVPAADMVSLTRRGKRDAVVEHAWAIANHQTGRTSDMVVPRDDTLLVSETFVARQLVWHLYQLKCYLEVTQFVEAFEAASERVRAVGGHGQGALDALVVEFTTLGKQSDALYIASLGEMHAHAKILRVFEQRDKGDLRRFRTSHDTFRRLMEACMVEHNARLARRILDQALDTPTLLAINAEPFHLALSACLQGQDRTREDLQHAMHMYRRMVHEVGYLLRPREWKMMLRMCLQLDRIEYVTEMLRDARACATDTALFQRRVEYALHVACRRSQFDTAVALARAWIEIDNHHQKRSPSVGDQRDHQAQAKLLNKLLWELLKDSSSSRNLVEDLLVLMQSRSIRADKAAVRRVVAQFCAATSTKRDDDARRDLDRFFALWERVPDTLQHDGFVVHTVLRDCASPDWNGQCERVIAYALEKNMDLPIVRSIRLMDRYMKRGKFDGAIEIAELVLQPRMAKARKRDETHASQQKKKDSSDPTRRSQDLLPDAFFTRLMRCYVALEQFEDVVRVDDAFDLTEQRGGRNAVLASLLESARAKASEDASHAGHLVDTDIGI